MSVTFHSIASEVINSAIYADCQLSKNALSQALNISRPSIKRYETIAFYSVPEFKEDYPKFSEEDKKKHKSSCDRTVPMSSYQCWVVSLIKTTYAILNKKESVVDFVKNNSYLFKRSNYHAQLVKLSKSA